MKLDVFIRLWQTGNRDKDEKTNTPSQDRERCGWSRVTADTESSDWGLIRQLKECGSVFLHEA